MFETVNSICSFIRLCISPLPLFNKSKLNLHLKLILESHRKNQYNYILNIKMSINVRQMKNFKLVGNTLDTNKEQSKSNSFLSSKPNSPSKASTPLTNKRAEVILVAKRVSTANRTPNCPEQPPRSTPTQRKSLPEIKQSNELDELKIQQLEVNADSSLE